MNYCIYKNREITVNQFEEYKLNLERPYICTKQGDELIYVSKSIDNKKSHFRFKSVPEWYVKKYGQGESEMHLKIKEHLYKLLQADGYECNIEVMIGECRADIVEVNRKMVYEIVTTKLTDSEIYKRALNYKENGYISFWYFHECYKIEYWNLLTGMYILDFNIQKTKYIKYYMEGRAL